MLGTRLGSYEVVDKLGEGGMGAVYLAKHTLLGRNAAVKVLRAELSRNREVLTRFFNEAQAATRIRHGGIVDVFDFGTSDDGQAFLLMEFLEGESFADRMARTGQMAERDVIRLGRQVAGALAAAHREGIIHRDLKPDNLFIVADAEVAGGERIKILDFGIAKLASDEGGGVTNTRTGAVIGTPLYMSPEQCRGAGRALDARVDCYSLGCVLFEMLCGQPPFSGDGPGEVISKHIYEAPSPLRSYAPHVSSAIESLVLSCLAKDAEARIGSMDLVVEELDRIRDASGPGPHLRAEGSSPARRSQEDVASTDAAHAETAAAEPDGATPVESTSARAETAAAEPDGATPVEPTSVSPDWDVAPRAGPVATPSLMSAPRSRRGIAIAGACAVVLGALVATPVLLKSASRYGGSPGAGEQAGPQPDARAVSARAEYRDAAAFRDAVASPETVVLEIESRPRGASVFDAGDARVGTTPLELEVERSREPVVLVVRADGYEEARVEVLADRNRRREVALERRARRHRPASPPRPPSHRVDDQRETTPEDGGEREDAHEPVDPFATRR